MRPEWLHPVKTMTFEEMWEALLKLGVSEETIQVVVKINGAYEETLEDILYATRGYRSFEQVEV